MQRLQGESKDNCNAYMKVDRTMQVLQDIRQNVDARHIEYLSVTIICGYYILRIFAI